MSSDYREQSYSAFRPTNSFIVTSWSGSSKVNKKCPRILEYKRLKIPGRSLCGSVSYKDIQLE